MGTFVGVASAVRISASRGRRLGSGTGPDSGCEAESDSLVSALAAGCAAASAPPAALPSDAASGEGGNTLAREAPGADESWSPAVDPVGSVLSAGSVDAFASTTGPERGVAS